MENHSLRFQMLPSFDELTSLAREDKHQFDQLTREIITQEIAYCKNQQHLQRIQFRLEGLYRKHKNPITRCQMLLAMIADESHKISSQCRSVNRKDDKNAEKVKLKVINPDFS